MKTVTIKMARTNVLIDKNRLLELFVGLSANHFLNLLFDYLLYPFIIYKLGVLIGGAVMTLLSLASCILLLQFYDWSKRDWLGIETIKGLRGYSGDKGIGGITSWVLRKSEPVVFLFLSIKFDAFITTVYMRHGKYNGMAKRDWKIFIGSLIVGNVYWIFACYMGISLFEWGWKTISC